MELTPRTVFRIVRCRFGFRKKFPSFFVPKGDFWRICFCERIKYVRRRYSLLRTPGNVYEEV